MALQRSVLVVVVISLAAFSAALKASPAAAAPVEQPCAEAAPYDNTNFPAQSTDVKINNKFFPLAPGMQYVFEGRANRGGGVLPHKVIFTVTDLFKRVDGVTSRVLWDVDLNQGVVSEAELAFFAQDFNGNVWSVGEYPEEYENGEFVGAPSTWLVGKQRAQAGVMMKAKPKLNQPEYVQGFAPKIEFLDCATVVATGDTRIVPAGTFTNVLVTDERSPLDPEGGIQIKYYAPRFGVVEIGARDDPEGETLVLVEVIKLSSEGRRLAREAALELEARAYKVAPVYKSSEPMFCLGEDVLAGASHR